MGFRSFTIFSRHSYLSLTLLAGTTAGTRWVPLECLDDAVVTRSLSNLVWFPFTKLIAFLLHLTATQVADPIRLLYHGVYLEIVGPELDQSVHRCVVCLCHREQHPPCSRFYDPGHWSRPWCLHHESVR